MRPAQATPRLHAAASSTPCVAIRAVAIGALAIGAGCSENAAAKNAAGEVPVHATTTADGPNAAATNAVDPPAAEAQPASTAVPSAPPAPPSGPRVYSKARFAWIQAFPRPSQGWIGYIGLGGSVPLKGGSIERAKVYGDGGCDVWYAVEPRGYVCAGDTATIDPEDPIVRALAVDAPKLDSPWPYEYGESVGAPRYETIPTEREQIKEEWDLPAHLAKMASARAAKAPEEIDKELVGVDLSPAGEGPPALVKVSPLVREGRRRVALGSTIAYTRSFDFGGRTFLLAHDRAIVPKDRVRAYPRAPFHGVELGEGATLPIAFVRRTDRPKYERKGEAFEQTSETWARHAWVGLTGEEVKVGKQVFLATREPGRFALATDVTVVKQDTPTPRDKRGAPDAKSGQKTWVEVSVLGGWLIAYEADKPVFATLISPGRGGIPQVGKDPLDTASTPTGTFRVDGKFLTATMVSSTNDLIVHTEVQYVQNFHGPHALHGAYWHDKWGELKSGGCVNLSPIDSKRVFEWTEPRIPPGWHGLQSVAEFGAATTVVVHR